MKRKEEFVEAAEYVSAEDEADQESAGRNEEEYQRHGPARHLTMTMQWN
jgi:hypothetical protein